MNNLANIGLGIFFISSKVRALISNPMNFVVYAFFSTSLDDEFEYQHDLVSDQERYADRHPCRRRHGKGN